MTPLDSHRYSAVLQNDWYIGTGIPPVPHMYRVYAAVYKVPEGVEPFGAIKAGVGLVPEDGRHR